MSNISGSTLGWRRRALLLGVVHVDHRARLVEVLRGEWASFDLISTVQFLATWKVVLGAIALTSLFVPALLVLLHRVGLTVFQVLQRKGCL